MRTSVVLAVGAAIASFGLPPAATAQQSSTRDRVEEAGKVAGDIASQPAKDLNLEKREIPPILMDASRDPYRLAANVTCQQLASEVTELNGALGADFTPQPEVAASDDQSASKVAEAGGRAVVNSFIPFRGVVREVSGAASAQRNYLAAMSAGFARRGFLRGVHHARNCHTTF